MFCNSSFSIPILKCEPQNESLCHDLHFSQVEDTCSDMNLYMVWVFCGVGSGHQDREVYVPNQWCGSKVKMPNLDIYLNMTGSKHGKVNGSYTFLV